MTDRRRFLAGLSTGALTGLAGCGLGGAGDAGGDGSDGDGDGGAPTDGPAEGPGTSGPSTATTTRRPTTVEPPEPAPPAPETMQGFRDAVASRLAAAESTIAEGPYEPTRESLSAVEPAPEWFRDAKFGIYMHLGPYAVPAHYSEWYPRLMYEKGGDVHAHHRETYGPPDEYPYQRFVPQFAASEFDAGGLAETIADAGAHFAGMTAKHADGFSNFDSAINPWNAAERGPQRDLLGELTAAVKNEGLHSVASFHHAYTRAHGYFDTAADHYPSVTEGYPDRIMYAALSASLFADQWLAECLEVLDRSAPDLVYFDSGLDGMPAAHRRRFLAAFYNRAAARGDRGVVTHKQSDLSTDVSVRDHEEGGEIEGIQEEPWLADYPISTFSWGYVEGQRYKPAEWLIVLLIDVVARNGQLMLNVSPRADGTLPAAQRDRLAAVGDWLDVHGDAIYGTRPWTVHGEAPMAGSSLGRREIRYTQSADGETLYAIALGWISNGYRVFGRTRVRDRGYSPPIGEWVTETPADGPSVRLLGHGDVGFRVTEEDHLEVEVPDLEADERPSTTAIAFAIDGFDIEAVEPEG